MSGAEPDQLSPERLAIIQQRLEDYKRGQVVPIPGELVRQRARRQVGLRT
jgi:hypothetical protein